MDYRYSQNDEAILAVFTKEITDHLPEWYGTDYVLSTPTPTIRSYVSCFMLHYSLAGSAKTNKTILVKVRRDPKMHSLQQAIANKELHVKIPAEYQDLVSLYSFFGNRNDHLSAIRPLQYLPEYFAIFMEEFPSQTISNLLTEKGTIRGVKENVDHLTHAAYLTGRILNIFHSQMHSLHEVEEPAQPIVNEILSLLGRLQTANHRNTTRADFEARFLQKVDLIRDSQITYSNSHGDFSCDNVLYSKEDYQLCMIDVKTRHAPIYSDIALIMIHPDVFKEQIFSFGSYFKKAVMKEYRGAILKGYFEDQPVNNNLISLYCAIKMLDKWVMYEEIMAGYKGRKRLLGFFAAPIVRLYFSTKTKHYLDQMIATR